MVTSGRDNPNQGRVYDRNGIAPCINCMTGGGRQPMVIELYEKQKSNLFGDNAEREGKKV